MRAILGNARWTTGSMKRFDLLQCHPFTSYLFMYFDILKFEF